jgi:hypothetical protein
MILELLLTKLWEICGMDLSGCTTLNHEDVCVKHVAGLFGAGIVYPVKGVQYCFYDRMKQLDLSKTSGAISRLGLVDGYYVFPCPYNRLSYVPPPDMFLFKISGGTVEDYVGFECKCSLNTMRPSWNDSPPRLFRDSRMLYIFSSINNNCTYVFAGDLLWDYSAIMGDIGNMRSDIDTGMSKINERIRGQVNKGGIEISYRMRYIQKMNMPGSVMELCSGTRGIIERELCGMRVVVSSSFSGLVDYDDEDGKN